jgi:hypothetical protein
MNKHHDPNINHTGISSDSGNPPESDGTGYIPNLEIEFQQSEPFRVDTNIGNEPSNSQPHNYQQSASIAFESPEQNELTELKITTVIRNPYNISNYDIAERNLLTGFSAKKEDAFNAKDWLSETKSVNNDIEDGKTYPIDENHVEDNGNMSFISIEAVRANNESVSDDNKEKGQIDGNKQLSIKSINHREKSLISIEPICIPNNVGINFMEIPVTSLVEQMQPGDIIVVENPDNLRVFPTREWKRSMLPVKLPNVSLKTPRIQYRNYTGKTLIPIMRQRKILVKKDFSPILEYLELKAKILCAKTNKRKEAARKFLLTNKGFFNQGLYHFNIVKSTERGEDGAVVTIWLKQDTSTFDRIEMPPFLTRPIARHIVKKYHPDKSGFKEPKGNISSYSTPIPRIRRSKVIFKEKDFKFDRLIQVKTQMQLSHCRNSFELPLLRRENHRLTKTKDALMILDIYDRLKKPKTAPAHINVEKILIETSFFDRVNGSENHYFSNIKHKQNKLPEINPRSKVKTAG